MGVCTLELNWLTYILASLVTFFGGLVLLLPFRLTWIVCRNRRKSVLTHYQHTQNHLASLRSSAEKILAGSSVPSKALVIVFWTIDLTVIAVYIVEASMYDPSVRDSCGLVRYELLPSVWLFLMCVNCIRFFIKFVAAHDKIQMWIDLYSIVDHLTIVPTFVGLYYDRNWIALRFLVVVQMLRMPDILQMIHILKDRDRIHIVKAITACITVWLIGAGMFFLLENNGDPFHDYDNSQGLTFGESFYFVLITLTTIGYGDIAPKTVLGRAAVVIYVVLALALFGSLIPVLSMAIGNRERHRRAYRRSFARRHIVICGEITFETLSTVVRNFIHKDAACTDIDIVIIDKDKPSSELQAFFRRRFNDVTFIRGSVIDIPTLRLAKVSQASSVFILANRQTDNPCEEDSTNVMRATAVKNLSPEIRIIIQLLHHQNKEQLLNIPGWNWQRRMLPPQDGQDGQQGQDGDEVICVSELQMALMAQNCLAPGIVTMFSNLICMRSPETTEREEWKNKYNQGAGHEIYSQIFSSEFHGLTFPEAVEICFTEFEALLVAVEFRDGNGPEKLKVNPGRSFLIASGHVGFFIAQDPDAMNSVANFHRKPLSATNPLMELQDKVTITVICDPVAPEDENIFEYLGDATAARRNSYRRSDVGLTNGDSDNNENFDLTETLDVTGMVHWCLGKTLEDVMLDEYSVREFDFENHVIFVLSGAETDGKGAGGKCGDAGLLGLSSFVSPLRASSLHRSELKHIIFYSDVELLESEWKHLANFPKLFVYQRTRSMQMELRLLNIHKCAMCIVSSVKSASMIDGQLIDKETILTTMNILGLQKLEQKVNSLGVLANLETFRKQIAIGCDFPLLSQLEFDSSIPYIDDDDDDDPSLPIYQTMPYVGGRVLLASVLDSVVSAAFLNGKVLKLIRALVTGGEISDLEKIMADGVGIIRRATLTDYTVTRKRSSLDLLSLAYGPLERFQNSVNYGELVVNSLRVFGLLCLGVYRLHEPESKDPKRQKRYVITNPPKSFQLIPSDRIYVLRPFDLHEQQCLKTNLHTNLSAC